VSVSPRPRRLLAALALALVLGAAVLASDSPAAAHELGRVQVEARFHKDGSYVLDLLIDLQHLPPQTSGGTSVEALLAELERSASLTFDGTRVKPQQGEVSNVAVGKLELTRLRLTGRTPHAVSRFVFANGAISGFFVLKLENEGQATPVIQWVEGGKESTPFPLDRAVVPESRWNIVRLYLGLGYQHIVPKGPDHVLFVLGIFLLAVELRPVLWQVTAFTLAHTITLALTVYGVVSLSPSVVEPLIALSIVYVAVENVFTARLHAWRPVVVFGFGLLHGMGFAGVLTEIGLPRSEFVPALLSFNLGVEAGQLTVILVAFLLLGLPFRKKPWYRRRIVVPGSLLIAAVGLYWACQRIFFA
jgi:hydrogenase/urease accessory protein HupE